ncbi:MAG: response regulator, partial [Proteobacteria bacterium]|nr:response regulator [Pseudomonadota bacterium]
NESLRLSEYLTRTELKEAQAKLEQYSKILEKNIAASEAKYRHVVENANEAIVIYQDERPQFFNARALAIFGCIEEEFGSLSFFSTVHQDDRYLVSQRYYRRFRGEKGPQLNEFRVFDKSGDVKWLQASMVVVDWEGRSAILAIMNDVTESIKARLEINKLQDQLSQSQKMEAIGTLAGGVAHDFNNILQAISGYVQLLLVKRDESDADYGALSEIDASVERAGQLIRQLLTFSRRIERALEPVDLNQEVLHACQFLERTIPKMILIENRLAGDLKQVSADKTQINQILMNLGSNASHAMPEGGRLVIETGNIHLDEFHCRANPDLEPGEYVFLRVSDNGHGIEEATIKHIFEPFFTTKGLGQGTGLGLATVYGIVTAHSGHVTCQSQVGQGTSFAIYLPAIETQPHKRAEEAGLEAEHLGGSETILLVDDERAILDAAEEMLHHYGYQTITASSGEEALDKYRTKGALIDVVILDLGMPGMGGQSCLKKILEFDPAARVIIASGYSAEGQIEEVIQSGAMDFIGKPYRLAELLRKIRGVLGNVGLTAERH